MFFSTVRDSAIAAVSDAEDLEDADEPRMVFHRYKLLKLRNFLMDFENFNMKW